MMMVAEEGSADRHLFNVSDTAPVQMNKKGMLIKGRGSLDGQFCQPTGTDPMHNDGGLIQEFGVPRTLTSALGPDAITPSPQSSDI